MKLKYFYTSICIMLMSIFCVNAQTVKNITLTEAGTLSAQITEAEQSTLTELTVTGPLNGTDIAFIRGAAPTLTKLDLKNASIVEGGNAYFVYNGTSHITKKDVIGDYMFFAMGNLKTLALPANAVQIGNNYYEDCYAIARCPMLETVIFPTKLIFICGFAFSECLRLPSIVIPEGVEWIGQNAFNECKNLKSAVLPASFGNRKEMFKNSYNPDEEFNNTWNNYVRFIFNNCSTLATVTIPDGVTRLSNGMFSNCSALTTTTLPSSLTNLNGAFYLCNGLESLTLPTGLTAAGSFENCTKLKTISIPDGVTVCPSFKNCTSLETVTLSNQLTAIGNNTFLDCAALTAITVPSTVTQIGYSAFRGCTSLNKVILSGELTSISEEAFYGCEKLTSITIPNKVTSLSNQVFSGCKALETVSLPRILTTIGYGCFGDCVKLKTINLPNGLFSIGNHAFNNNTSLEEIQLPNNLTEISTSTFAGCTSLKDVKLPTSLLKIGSSAFQGCTLLTKIAIPGATMEIGSSAFADTGLSEVVLNNGLISLGKNAFSGCNKLTTVTFPETIDVIGGFNNTGVSTVKFAEGSAPTQIDNNAFSSCPNLKTFIIPASVTKIGNEAFSYSGLESIKLPETVTEYGSNIFSVCDNLTEVEFPQNMTIIPNNIFYSCKNLKQITLPSNISIIDSYAFNNCSNLEEINLPETLMEIKEGAFSHCRKLTQIALPKSITTINREAFSQSGLRDIEIPTGTVTIGVNAFSTYNNLNSIVWNSATTFPNNVFSHTKYLFLPEGGTVANENCADLIFYNGMTDSLHIDEADRYNNPSFTLPRTLKAKKVAYERYFSATSGYGEAAGWQTIVLPFDVTEITHTRGYGEDMETLSLAPFGSAALETTGTLPFWLYELGTDGNYKAATAIKAHHPYLICMPNNDKYPSSSNISGEVKFANNNEAGVALTATEGALKPSVGTKFNLVPTYDQVMMSESVYALNTNNWYNSDEKQYAPGSVFVKNYNDGGYTNDPAVYPFRAYLTSNETQTATSTGAPMLYSIGGGDGTITGIEDIPFSTPEKATKAYSRDGVLYINTNADRTINIYDVTGRTVRIIEAREGMNEVHGLDSGIYLLEGQKVVIGR